jgi:hypothetical protein
VPAGPASDFGEFGPPELKPDWALVDVLPVTVENNQPHHQRCRNAGQLTKIAADNMNRCHGLSAVGTPPLSSGFRTS